MSQQADNGEFSRYNAKRNCCTYLCFKIEKENFQYDIINNDRYHRTTEKDRESI